MSGKAVRETLAALGVIASLVFVGFEIRQNTSATRSATQNAIYDAGRQGTIAVLGNGPLIEVEVAVQNDPTVLETLDGTVEGRLHEGLWNMRFSEMENAHFHFREGTLTDELWSGWKGYIVERAATPSFRHYWEAYQTRYGDEFRAMVEDVLDDLAP